MSQISSHNSSIRYLSPRNSRCKCTSCMISYSCSRSRCTCIDTHMDRYRKQRLQNRRRQRSRWQEWCQQWYQGRVQWLIFPLMLGRVFLHSARPTTQYSLPPLQPHNSIHTVEYTHYIRQLSRLAYNPHADRRHRPVCHTWLYKTCVTKIVHGLALRGLNPGTKFTNKKNWLTCYPPRSYHAKFHRPRRRYPLQKYLRTKLQTNKQ